MSRVDAFIEQLGLPVRDRDLIQQALTHSSWQHENRAGSPGHNERLEQLGDAVVNLAISEALFQRYPDDDEGVLSARRAAIVSTIGLARLADRIDLGRHILLGEGERQQRARLRPSLLASAFEAVAGALHLDLGWDVARDWVVTLAAPEIDHGAPALTLKSPKSRLQEHTQRVGGRRPSYELVEATGPDHDKLFVVQVTIDGEVLGIGEGPSRRTAESQAATQALSALEAAQAADDGPGPETSDATPGGTEEARSNGPTGARAEPVGTTPRGTGA